MTPTLPTLRVRILASAVATALLAVVLVWATSSLTLSVLFPKPEHRPSERLLAACRADPGGWIGLELGHASLTAYDADGRAVDGQVLDLGGWPSVPLGETVGREEDHRWSTLTHASADGGCAWLLSTEGPPPAMVATVRWATSAGTFLALLLAGGLSYAVAVRPLVARIERLRDAAVRIGTTTYASAGDTVPDALGEISSVLDGSHGRILADRDELVRRHEALERYLAEIAHDLRTPIGSLLLALQEVGASPAADEVRAATRRATTDAAYLGSLVENLHQAARLRHGLDPLEAESDLRDVLQRLEVRFRALGRVQEVEVAVAVPDHPVWVRCTPVLAERALANLFHNSLAHGAKHVAVRLDAVGGRFVVVVVDDGPGVADPADLAARTFDDRPERPRGPGLGLAITNEIARRAGFAVDYQQGGDGGLDVRISGPTSR